MAITRAQQARQMYKKGSMEPVEQAGVMNYMPSEMVTVPKIAKSSPDTPTAKLAYITPKEEDILVDLNLYGSLKGKPNRGPGGIPSLEGDFGPGGKGDYSEEGTGRGVGPGSKDKDISAFTDTGTGKYEVSTRPEDRQAVIDYSQGKLGFQKGKKPGFFTGPGSFKQKQQIYNIQQRLNAINRYTNARKNKIIAGLKELNLNPAYDEEDETFADLISQAPSIASMTDTFSPQTISDVLAGNRQIDFFSKIDPNLAPGLGTKGLVGLANLIGPKMGGPVTQEKLNSLLGEIDKLQNINPADTTTKDLMKEFAPNQYDMVYGPPEKEGEAGIVPRIRYGVPAAQTADADDSDYYGGKNPFDINRVAYRLMADGGAVMDDEPRQAYGLGSIVKKATRAVKKVVKSDIGKAALTAAAIYYGGGGGNPFTAAGRDKFAFANFFSTTKNPLISTDGKFSALKAIGLPTIASYLMTPKPEEEEEEDFRGEGLDIPLYRRNPEGFLAPRFRAEGGSINEKEKEPVAKKVMPLIDMDGKEKDYRETGGFVDIGRMEKADDVPARLSKNEFVFTADAVRNAGDGSVDKGAEVMYNMMKNLEAGGEVSEESQGLKGARKMFQTSQRLEEVL
jgi:hypothetical protein